MKVKELIEKLQELNPDMKVTTFADYDEAGHGDLHSLWEDDVYDENGNETGEKVVHLDFYFDGQI